MEARLDLILGSLPGLILLAVLLLANAAFVGTEFAYVTVRRSRINQLAAQGNVSARAAQRALGNLDYYVAAAQLGITMAVVAIGWFGEPALAHLVEPPVEALVGGFASEAISHSIAIAFAFALASALHMLIGEFVPKTIALQEPEKSTLWLALPIEIFVRIFGPFITVLNNVSFALVRMLGVDVRPLVDDIFSAEDLSMSLEQSASAGLISQNEFRVSRRTISLVTLEARELMVPRTDIVAISVDASAEDVANAFLTHRHTRYPVYQETLDDVIGVLDAKNVVLDDDLDADWRRHLTEPVLVPETVLVDRALELMQAADSEIAILIDEYGGTAGMLSTYDVLDFLAGHLPDQAPDEAEIHHLPDGSVMVAGLTRIDDLIERLDLKIPEVDAETVSGLVMIILDRVPVVGDEFRLDAYRARVEAVEHWRVERLLLIPDDGSTVAEGDARP